jgi:apolipoprotein N-acyltransferase
MPRSASAQGWLERFSIFEKGPFAFFFGALLGISTPGFDLWWVAWIGLAPLLVLVRASRTQFEATMTGLLFGLGYYLVALSWYLGLFPLRWLGIDDWVAVQAVGLVWVLESVHEALLLAAFAWLVYCLPFRFSRARSASIFPVYAQCSIDLGLPSLGGGHLSTVSRHAR